MNYEEIKAAWNAQADEYNQWDELSEVEKIEWAAQAAADKEREACAKERTELLEAAKAALKEAEAWIQDQLGGTSSYQPAMDDLQPIRSALIRAEAAE